jgi:hypothetical protein
MKRRTEIQSVALDTPAARRVLTVRPHHYLSQGGLPMSSRIFGVVLALLLGGCAAELGACPSPDDCACPCTDEAAPVCSSSGEVYHNNCVLECNGLSSGSCANGMSAEELSACNSDCDGSGGGPECGSLTEGGDTTYELYDNACLRQCAGAKKEGPTKC